LRWGEKLFTLQILVGENYRSREVLTHLYSGPESRKKVGQWVEESGEINGSKVKGVRWG